MKTLHVLANDGSPLGVTVKSIWGLDGGYGVGGAELAILTLCEGWHERGYDVTFYNNPREGGVGPFKQKTLDEFNPNEDRDYLIVFRSPNHRIEGAKGKKIWFSCDQATIGDFKAFSKEVEKIVVISPRHAEYFNTMYGIENTVVIDLPVRTQDYRLPIEKESKKCIYTSMPDRGVMPLHAAWPLIHREVPEASLVITSDQRLWNKDFDASMTLTPWRLHYASHANVSYIGAVRRNELVEHQLSADVLLYPCTYDELFCITAAEAQVAGALPITSQVGSLVTTNEFGIQIPGFPTEASFIEAFVQSAVQTLQDPTLCERQLEMREKARERFSLDRILDEWEERVFERESD